jgi:hypothetical protein
MSRWTRFTGSMTLAFAACWLTGCATVANREPDVLLFDGARPPAIVESWTLVDDPFAKPVAGQSGPAGGGVGKVIKAGSAQPPEPFCHHAVFLSDSGFFSMPASGRVSLRLVVGVVRLTTLRVELVAREPACKMRFDVTVPATDSWQEIVLPLDPAKIKPGSTVVDITLFQMGRDPQSRLYVKRVALTWLSKLAMLAP